MLTELIVPLVSVVGTSTAVLIAVDQITAGSRLRRQAIFWRDMAAQEHALSRDSDVSHSLQREALGKLVALSALPAKWLLVPALLVFSAVAAAVMLGVRIGGEIPPAELTWTKLLEKEEQDPGGTLVLIVLPSVASLGTAAFLNPLLLRKKVARAYLDGDPLELDSINAGRSLKDNLGGLGLVLIFAFGFGLTGMAAAIGGFAGAGPNPASISEWVVLVLFLGAALASTSGLALYAKVQDYAKEEWHHPGRCQSRPPHTSQDAVSEGLLPED